MFATAARFAVKSLFIFKSIRIKTVLNLLTPSSLRAAESVAARLLACLLITALLFTATILPWSKVKAAESEKTSSLPSAGTGNSSKSGGNLAVPEAFSFPAPATSGNNSGTNGETFSLKSVATNLAAGIANPLSRMFDFSESGSSAAPDLTTEGAETVSAESPTSSAPAGINPASRKISVLPANSSSETSAAKTTSAKAISPVASVNSAASAPRFASKLTTFDFNGDGRHDYAVFRPSTGWWYVLMSNQNGGAPTLVEKHWGTQGDKPVPADYDGDNKTDYAVYRPTSTGGTWCIVRSSNNVEGCQQFGANDDLPIPADYDGDGKADLAVFRPSTGAWYILYSATTTMYGVQWGANGDVPVPGEYEATPDGKTDIAVWRPSTGYLYIYTSGNSYIYYPWGLSTDVPVPGDYDGDGRTDYGMWRPSTGYWYIIQSSNGSMVAAQMGSQDTDKQDVPVPADYDGDGKDDIAVWRAVNGTTYYFKSNSNNALALQPHGSYGDMPAPSSYIKRTPSSPATAASIPALSSARLSPQNETGGTNLYSRNFSWGTGLVSLPGRAGMDLGLGLSYNSLVWTKVDGESKIVFDADKSNITPGFRFGFPVIEPVYADPLTGQNKHIMLTPSGARVELRQTSYSSSLNAAIYDAVDSSYTQMKVTGLNLPVDQQTLVLRTASGTVMKYAWSAGAFRCTEIVDKNGNYITVNHDSGGILRSVTDTLGRIVLIEYDGNLPTSIKQAWNGGGYHIWASFSYTTTPINYNFGSLGVTGLPNNSSLKVLDRVTFADQSSYKFNYNIYGQVTRVSQYAADLPTTHRLNYVNVNLTNYAGDAQTDCPRFSETQTWAENFNNGNEVITKNTIQEGKSFTVPGTQTTENGSLITVTEASGTTEDVITESYVHSSGSKEGLSFATETCESANPTSEACTATNRKRWTWTKWDLDTAGVNPRITETKVGDNVSTKRTEITYHSNYGLVNEVKEWGTNELNQQIVLRKTATDYNLSANYITTTADNLSSNYITEARRIIGLPSEKRVYEGDTLVSRVGFAYDGTTVEDTGLNTTQHGASYGTSFVIGRGNLTSVTRYRTGTTDTTSPASIIVSTTKYNKTGSVVSSTDAANRTTKIFYTDKFVNSLYQEEANRNTYAYPTQFTTPGATIGSEVSSYVKYRFDIGANVQAISAAPAGNHQSGKETRRTYDAFGRLEKDALWKGGAEYAYTRYVYEPSATHLKVFSTITDANNNNVRDTADEVLTETFTDGTGRARKTRTPMSWNTAGTEVATYSAQQTEYDVFGRIKKQSVPTEVDMNWQIPTTSEDYRGTVSGQQVWLWTTQEYDWKGRTTRIITTDSNGNDGKDRIFSYDGCGCAGGEVVTVLGESVPRDDLANTNARRKQKIYSDILGREFKTEVYKWDGTTVYSTTLRTLNALDQATSIAQTDHNQSPAVTQTSTFAYDGYGRTWKTHRPEQQNTDGTPAYTVYAYNSDDSVQSVADARGAVTNYSYNDARGLLTNISYAQPQNNPAATDPLHVAPASAVAFGYDAVGNRTWMTDGLGRVDHEYNQLSQMTAETRKFNDTLPNAPLSSNNERIFRLEYGYTLSGQLKSLKDPYGQQFNYSHDKVGRLSSVTGSTAYAGLTTYANAPKYNARGTLTGLHYGNGTEMSVSEFNNKLQATKFEVKKGTTSILKKEYQFYDDGSLKYSKDVINPMFDRSYKYDHLGRTVEAKSGANARGLTDSAEFIPYKQNFGYNAFSNIVQTTMEHYASGQNSTNYTYTNNRSSHYSATYDVEGNQTHKGNVSFQYDAAGRLINSKKFVLTTGDPTPKPTLRYFDGIGQEIKRIKDYVANGDNSYGTSYFIRSSVTGKIVSEADSTGEKVKTFVSANGTTLAMQILNWSGANRIEHLAFQHQDASGSSLRYTTESGEWWSGLDEDAEFDAQGNNVGFSDPYLVPNDPIDDTSGNISFSASPYLSANGGGHVPFATQYYQDGIEVPEYYVRNLLGGSGVGGQFGLLEWSARMSAQVTVRTNGGQVVGTYANKQSVPEDYARGRETGEFTYSYNSSWQVSFAIELLQQTQQKQKAKSGPDLAKLQQAVDHCARTMFGVTLTKPIDWSRKGDDGRMDFRTVDGSPSIFDWDKNIATSTFFVTNVTTSVSFKETNKQKLGWALGIKGAGLYSTEFYDPDVKKTYTGQTWTTFTVRDRNLYTNSVENHDGAGLGISGFIHTQIHETGNALAFITGKHHANPVYVDPKTGVPNYEAYAGDVDSGQAYEVCVIQRYKTLLANPK